MTKLAFDIEIRSDGRRIVAVSGFELAAGCVTFLFGESGIGKSLLCKTIYGMLDPAEAEAVVNGRPYVEHYRNWWTTTVQKNGFFVFQEPSSHLNPLIKIADQLNEGSLADAGCEVEILRSLWEGYRDGQVRSILEVFPKAYRPSGGEKQRVLLAMAFKKIARLFDAGAAQEPHLFVFDEPTGSLDDRYRNIFLRMLFDRFERQPFTTVVITHDYSMISELCRQYHRHRRSILFKELVRCNDQTVTVRDFSASRYLDWIRTLRPLGNTAAPEAETVIEMGADVEIFGRRLRLYTDAARSIPGALKIRRGEMVYLKAPSGVGKTTIAKIIAGLYRADYFSMTLCGRTISHRSPATYWRSQVWGRIIAMAFQHADEALDMQATVSETFRGLPGRKLHRNDTIKKVLGTIFEGEINDDFLNKKVAFLSGGQKQRLNLLRTLVLHTRLVILDEPLNGLDFVSIEKVICMLEENLRRGQAIIMISHNEEIFDALVAPQHTYYLSAID